jgi:outer membrane immunogenic protein
MKTIMLGAVALVAIGAVPALAADLPAAPVYTKAPPVVAPVYNWTGCYIGGDVGGGWARQNANTYNPAINAAVAQAPDYVTLKGSGAIGGAYVGCNYQFANSWVVGLEGDYSWSQLSDTQTGPNNSLTTGLPFATGSVAFSRNVTSIASIRGRVGYLATPSVLAYVTGGGAWARAKYSGLDTFITGCPNCASFANSNTSGGWVAGVGVEWAATSNWLFRAEYLHYGFNGSSTTALFTPPPFTGPGAQYNYGSYSVDEVRVGVSYKFGWAGPVVAKY